MRPLAIAGLAIATAIVVGASLRAQSIQGRLNPAPTSTIPQFENIAAAAGISFPHVSGASPDRHLHEIMSGGGLFFDYDQDGWVDIFIVDGGSLTNPAVARTARHRLFRNRGNGAFADTTATSGLLRASYGMGA